MDEELLDQIASLAEVAGKGNESEQRAAYRMEMLVLAAEVRREGNPEQISRIREHIRTHRGEDHRPFIKHIMGWD